jgi:hypothetical protein
MNKLLVTTTLGSVLFASASALATNTGASYVSTGIVRVECQGNCNAITAQQACNVYNSNSRPLALACVNPQGTGGSGTAHSCGTASGTCIEWGSFAASDPIGSYCQDVNGYDAVVTCEVSHTHTE